MNRKQMEQWKGKGDCNLCINKRYCKEGCEAHDVYLSRQVKKALLEAHEAHQQAVYKGEEL